MAHDISNPHIRKNPWVKDILKTYNEEVLSDLIRERIENSTTVGPYFNSFQGEKSTNIINDLILFEEGFRKKIVPAICLLFFRAFKNEIKKTPTLMRGVFNLIQDNKIEECHNLVEDWLRENFSTIASAPNEEDKLTYREALNAFAHIQKISDEIELYWSNMWKESVKFWWATSFTGLRLQNPKVACKELPLLVERKIDNVSSLLYAMWTHKLSRPLLEKALAKGLKEDTNWSGIALNHLMNELSYDHRNELLSDMKRIPL